MRTRLLSFGVWALVAASALFWGLKLFVPRGGLPAQALTPARHVAMNGELRRLLGVTEVATNAGDEEDAPDSGGDRFQLLGVVAPRGAGHSPQGVALISVGGQPARPWRTGAVVDGDTVLLSVSRRAAQLGPRGGPVTTELTLPEPPQAGNGGMPPVARAPVSAPLAPQQAISPMQQMQQAGGLPGQMRPMPAQAGLPQPQHPTAKPVPPDQGATSGDDAEEE